MSNTVLIAFACLCFTVVLSAQTAMIYGIWP